MKWEVKELPDGRWGIFLCKKYWKFKDGPVCYSASITKALAELRVRRLNNPDYFSNDENCITVKMAREKKKKDKIALKNKQNKQ